MSDAHRLAGNGTALVRERALAARVQGALERVYQLDRVADVGDFLHGAEEGEREALLLREADDGGLEVTLRVPQLGRRTPGPMALPQRETSEASLSKPDRQVCDSRSPGSTPDDDDGDLDALCQIIEGVSHFVYVVERARVRRETTRLELELQAEVDKWLVLAASMRSLDVEGSAALRTRLYEQVVFEHDRASEQGERYRVANDAANRFVRRLERDYVGPARYDQLRLELRRFFHVGQEEKLRLGHC